MTRKSPPEEIAASAEALAGLRQAAHPVPLRTIAGGAESVRAIANIQRICRQHRKDRQQLEAVDRREHPMVAKVESIVPAPVTVRKLSMPLRRVIESEVEDRP